MNIEHNQNSFEIDYILELKVNLIVKLGILTVFIYNRNKKFVTILQNYFNVIYYIY